MGGIKKTKVYNKNWKDVQGFVAYCTKHPNMRFWQALSNWSGCEEIYAFKQKTWNDTYYWENSGGDFNT